MPTSLRRIFLNPQGLRAGWGIALYSVLPACLALFNFIISHYYPAIAPKTTQPAELQPALILFSEAFSFGALALIAFLISFLERRPFSSYGLTLQRALPDFATGLFWGFLMLSALIAALYATHSIAFHGLALHGRSTLAYGLYWLAAFLFVALFEEFFFRGYLQATLTRGLTRPLPPAAAFWFSAAVLSGALFAYAHTGNAGETPWGIAAVALAGLTFAFALYRTGSLWWAIGFHTAWDWAQSFLYGTPDSGTLVRGHLLATTPIGSPILSGATTGPEGSLLVIPTLLLTCLIIHVTLPKNRPLPIYTSD